MSTYLLSAALVAAVSQLSSAQAQAQAPGIVTITNASVATLPYSYTYRLPSGFNGTIPGPGATSTFANDTTTPDAAVNAALAAAVEAPFISFSEEFSNLLGPNPEIRLINDTEGVPWAFEGGAWLPDRNEVWFSSSFGMPPGFLSILNLETGEVTRPDLGEWQNFQRGFYNQNDGLVYYTSWRDDRNYTGGLIAIDPETYNVTLVLNTYFGLRFNGLNDVVPAASPEGGDLRYLLVSDSDFLLAGYPDLPAQQTFNSIYRWDMQEETFLPILSRSQNVNPNALAVSPDGRSLYVGDFGYPAAGEAYTVLDAGVAGIYKYDITEDARLVNQRLWAVPRFFLDGLKTDDRGRVWSAEGDGLVVRSSEGRILGVLNMSYFGRSISLANLALAGDYVVVLGVDRLWTVRLAEQIVSSTSRHVFG